MITVSSPSQDDQGLIVFQAGPSNATKQAWCLIPALLHCAAAKSKFRSALALFEQKAVTLIEPFSHTATVHKLNPQYKGAGTGELVPSLAKHNRL